MLYQTQDTIASVRRAFAEYTHVVVNRSYHILKPAMLRTGQLVDLPVYVFLPWQNGSDAQLAKWKAEGGILLDASYDGHQIGPRDVTVIAEAPTNMARLKAIQDCTAEYVVVNRPVSWRTHEDAVRLHAPPMEDTLALREAVKRAPPDPQAARIAAASRYPTSPYVCADVEAAKALGRPEQDVRTMRKSLNCQEIWCVQPRTAPDYAAPAVAWAQIMALPDAGGGERIFATLEGLHSWRRVLKEMGRRGYIGLRRYYVYAPFEPPYKRIEATYQSAQADFKAVRELVESTPQHLPSQPLSDESP